MINPRTTWSGIIGLIGTIMATIGAAFPMKAWAQIILAIGIALKGADSFGNIASKDG